VLDCLWKEAQESLRLEFEEKKKLMKRKQTKQKGKRPQQEAMATPSEVITIEE
jgi:hypothetical protein